MGRMIRGSMSGRGKVFFSPKLPGQLWSFPKLLFSGYQSSFYAGKVAGAWSCPLTPYNAGDENEWSYTATSPISLHGVCRNCLIFHLLFLNNCFHGADLFLES